MTEPTERDLFDRASRDESTARAAQQVSAGAGHRPVHGKPPFGEASATPRSPAGTVALSDAYVRALEVERDAWHNLSGLPGDAEFDRAAWDAWRGAVEAKDLATRLLINYSLSSPGP